MALFSGIVAMDYTEGHMDVELNDVGRQQAMAVAGRLAEESEISAVYSSDLKRARQTAQIIASRCNVPEDGSRNSGQRVIVVTHGGVVRAFHKYAAPAEELPGKIKNTSINIFPMAGEDKWTIKTWGDIRHLSNIGFLETAFGGNTNSG
ncbi:phosphoglycerate mutase, putative [Ricinus communis]|uniref:Phosphoglycerate mutase, putative n=1 Tax=Ricinus communis TaxID=3988 RepID=B9R7H8_RICCO|nr:phosphoglycerate mutase, putative [Ricinus communis]